jgi:hypothetical protein
VRIVAGEMKDSVADDHISAGIVERHMFDGFDSEIRIRERGREHPGEGANALHGLRVRVHSVNFVPLSQEVDEVSTGTASGFQYSHPRCDAAFEKLVEKIDVDGAELFLQRERGHFYKASVAARLRQAVASVSLRGTRKTIQ